MVVHADGEGVAIEARSKGASGAISLEGKMVHRPPLDRMTEDAEPLHDASEHNLNTTTNLIGAPEDGKKVRAPSSMFLGLHSVHSCAHDVRAIYRACWTAARTSALVIGRMRPLLQAGRRRRPEELGNGVSFNRGQLQEVRDEVVNEKG